MTNENIGPRKDVKESGLGRVSINPPVRRGRSQTRRVRDNPPYHRGLLCALLCLFLAITSGLPAAEVPVAPSERATVVVVIGAAGEADFGENFSNQAKLWEKVCEQAGAKRITIGLEEPTTGGPTDLDRLNQALAAEPKDGGSEFWLVLIGHGTFDGRDAKFNLRGPDLASSELAAWLKPFTRPMAVIDTSSGSAPFIAKLTGKNRVIVSATRSGNELNYARFGQYFSAAMLDPKSDLDQDGQTSLLEAFLSASANVLEFYKTEGRLSTEHALIEDNGDGLGTPSDWFRGTRAIKKARDGGSLDGARAKQFHLIRSPAEQKMTAEQRARRDQIELEVEVLREKKAKVPEDEYYHRLEGLMLEMADVYGPAQEGP